MKTDFVITSEQVRAARALIRWEQRDLAETSKVSLPSIKRLETTPGPLAAQARTIEALRATLEAAGVEFTNGEQPGVRIKSFKLKDVGENPFYWDHMSKLIAFAAKDGERRINICVEDLALEWLEDIRGGAGYPQALQKHRGRIFRIAARKYELGHVEPGEIISVMYADVAG
jgi:hypothetical protein